MDEQDTGFIFMLMTVWDVIWSVCLQRKGFGNGRLLLQFFKYEGEITASEAAVSSEMSTGKLVRVPDISSHEIIVKQSVNSDKPSGKNMFSMIVLEIYNYTPYIYTFTSVMQGQVRNSLPCSTSSMLLSNSKYTNKIKKLICKTYFLKGLRENGI